MKNMPDYPRAITNRSQRRVRRKNRKREIDIKMRLQQRKQISEEDNIMNEYRIYCIYCI